MAVKGLKEITAIAALLVANAFFGISSEQTSFIFPAFGQEVFKIINFYTTVLAIAGVAFGLVLLYRHIKNTPLELPTIPSTAAVVINYSIFIFISYVLINWLFTGGFNIPIPEFKDIIEQTIISADENTIAFIFFATIFPLGTGIGDAKTPAILSQIGVPQLPWTIIQFGEYRLRFNPPNFNRFKYGLYAILTITLLHAGRYSYQVSSFSEFYIALFIAFLMFGVLWYIKEAFGFGACIATHVSWNLILLELRGSVY